MAMCVHSAPGVYALLLGSGISTGAGVLTGWGIMQDLAQRVAALLGQTPEQVALAHEAPDRWWRQHFPDQGPLMYSTLLGELGTTPAARQSLLQEYFTGKEPSAAHRAIAGLVRDGYVRVILTTNFDPLMEDALHAAGVQFQVITGEGASSMRPLAHGLPTVLKLHGDFRQPDMLNTTTELARYGWMWRRRIREVFRDFGLIVCGWSAEWDTALIRCLTGRSHRFPVFWSSFRSPAGRAAELIAQLGALPITDTSADGLFTGLASDVAALERMADLPPTRDMAVHRLKQCLSDPARRVDLHDLLDRHADQTIGRLQDRKRHPDSRLADLGTQAYRAQLDLYRADAETLLYLLATGVFHDRQAEHAHLWVRVLQRLVDARDRLGDDVADKARHYPALLALYAAGCAAVLNGREDVLARLLTGVIWEHPTEWPAHKAGQVLRTFDVLGEGRALEEPVRGVGGTRSAQSSRVRADLREVLGEACAHSDRAFREGFDRLEYLMLLVQADLNRRRPPVRGGTFLALGNGLQGNLVADHKRVAAQVARSMTAGWPMLTAAFDGEARRTGAAAATLAATIKE
ncbi:hypothetical protein GCM10010440_71370 [Kitasatospora cinereorecta]